MVNASINSLIEGYRDFKKQDFDQSQLYSDLATYGQKPHSLIVACCDSRLNPAIITGCQPGQLFVVRNVANLVPPYENDDKHHGTSAALEFAVKGLAVQNIIILGHSHCGGIEALMSSDNTNKTDFINQWMSLAQPAKNHIIKKHSNCSIREQNTLCEKESLALSLSNLTSFPWIRDAVTAKKLALHAWHFDIETGNIESYQDDSGEFILL